MDSSPAPLICSPAEAALLASLLGARQLLGLPDPFHGWLNDEITATWAAQRPALTARRWLFPQADGRLVLDTLVAALFGTWAFADASFIVYQATPATAPAVHYFHATRHLALEQTLPGADTVQLVALPDTLSLYQRVCAVLGLAAAPAEPGAPATPPATLPITRLGQARATARAGALAPVAELLQACGLAPATVQALAATLHTPSATGLLIGLAPRLTTWEVTGLGLLAGPHGLWRLRLASGKGEAGVELAPCSAAEAGEAVRRVLNRVLPVPLPLGTAEAAPAGSGKK